MPGLELTLAGQQGDVLPGQRIDYRLTATNTGARVVVPGLVGVENVDTVAATVEGFELAVDRFSVADQAWVPLATTADGTLDVALRPNPAPGARRPA